MYGSITDTLNMIKIEKKEHLNTLEKYHFIELVKTYYV
jgi:hypothetical protein